MMGPTVGARALRWVTCVLCLAAWVGCMSPATPDRTTADAETDARPWKDAPERPTPHDASVSTDIAQDSAQYVPVGFEQEDVPDPEPPITRTPLRLSWSIEGEPTEDAEVFDEVLEEVPVAVAPDGTVYVVKSRIEGARRLIRERDQDESLVTAFGADASIRFRVPAIDGVAMMPRGLVADASGVYLFVRVERAFEILGTRVEPTSLPASALIALSPDGALRWVQLVGAAAWHPLSTLSGRRTDRLVVLGTASGGVALGAMRATWTEEHLVLLELTYEGAPIAVRDLGVATRGTRFDTNARGDVVALDERLRRWSPEGLLVDERSANTGRVALDDAGNVYILTDNMRPPGSAGFAACVIPLTPNGTTPWRRCIFLDENDMNLARAIAWRDGRLRVAIVRGNREWNRFPPLELRCTSYPHAYASVSFDELGQSVRHNPSSYVPHVAVSASAQGCAVEIMSLSRSCRSFLPAQVSFRCGGDRRGCASDEVRCGDRCVNLQADPLHCGACGRACAGVAPHATGVCVDGNCHFGVCDVTHASCDGDAHNGCEVDVATDPAHCGACDLQCAQGERCVGGRCCDGDRCAESPYGSDGRDARFAPARDVAIDGAVRQVSTMTIPEGVTVRSADNVLRIYAQGEVRIDGTIDVTGRRPVGCEQGSLQPGCELAPPGADPGQDGRDWGPGCASCDSIAPTFFPVHTAYRARERWSICRSQCSTFERMPISGAVGHESGDGSIGRAATEDLAVRRVFEPGSRGGTMLHFELFDSGYPRRVLTQFSGGGGGAVRIASGTRIVLGPRARIVADGRGGGSGGVVVLHAPEVRVAPGAWVSARGVFEGTTVGTSLGRVRVAVDPARCTLDGTFYPPLLDGCRPTPPMFAPARTYVTPWPL